MNGFKLFVLSFISIFLFFSFALFADEKEEGKIEKNSLIVPLKISNEKLSQDFENEKLQEEKQCKKLDESFFKKKSNLCRTHSNSKCGTGGVCYSGFQNYECTVCFDPKDGFRCQNF